MNSCVSCATHARGYRGFPRFVTCFFLHSNDYRRSDVGRDDPRRRRRRSPSHQPERVRRRSRGLRYYILGNEPSIWHSTHRDVRPTGATMDEVHNKAIEFGAMIRAIDPSALVVAPEEWDWSGACRQVVRRADRFTSTSQTPTVTTAIDTRCATLSPKATRSLTRMNSITNRRVPAPTR